ncbi:hypothetical protein ABH926_005688 [Catenulispora sp. GP43]|uniref:hypothetical protein n=1 Tax=Catenulispora sp. GP43 TaxID=3156263 RepID=UPI0035184B20
MIRTARTVALLTALAFGAVAGPIGAATTPQAQAALRPATTTAPSNPGLVGELLEGVLAPLAPVVDAVLTGFDEAFTVTGNALIHMFVPTQAGPGS